MYDYKSMKLQKVLYQMTTKLSHNYHAYPNLLSQLL